MKILVVGGGIVGISCGLHLLKLGHEVAIADPNGFGQGASFGNAGVLAVSECLPIATPELVRSLPSILFSSDSPIRLRASYLPKMAGWLWRFLRSSKRSQVEHACEALSSLLLLSVEEQCKLAQEAGVHNMIEPNGWYKVYETEAAFKAAKKGFELVAKYGVQYEYLISDEFYDREPSLNGTKSPRFKYAVYNSQSHQIKNPQLYVEALGEYFLRLGGKLIKAQIKQLKMHSDHVITHALCGEHMHVADAFVIAAGAWSKKLAQDCGEQIPLDTERGYHVEFEATGDCMASAPVLWGERSIVMSPMNNKLRVTSGVEFAGLQAQPRFELIMQHENAVRELHNQKLGLVSAKWLGFRPSMPDSLPVISRTRAENAYFAFGHGHLGLTLGPITGRIIADLISGNIFSFDISPFSATRFK